MSVIKAKYSSYVVISSLIMNWYMEIVASLFYHPELLLFVAITFSCIGVCLVFVFIRLFELNIRSRKPRHVNLGKVDLAVFVGGSIVFFGTVVYGLMANPEAPLSTISDVLGVIGFIISIIPFIRKLMR